MKQLSGLHDAALARVVFGPRRELRLVVWRSPDHAEQTLRFGAIENLVAVRTFFQRLPAAAAAGAALDRIDRLALLPRLPGTSRCARFLLALDHAGRVEITCGHFSVAP